ncbi:hypothetical protein DFJ74DRAFT_258637 [Hyaloraphidium curvatum]|nr:hypothetical protein DFJ74DRAFT_258637 [Hyaloraphidium curvatum]
MSDPSDGLALPPELLLNVARSVPARTLLEMALASRGACELLLPHLAPRLLDMVFDYGVNAEGELEWSRVFRDLDGMWRFVGGSAGAGEEGKFRLCRRLVLLDSGAQASWPWDSGLVVALAPRITDLEIDVRNAGALGRFSALPWPNVDTLRLQRDPYLEPQWKDRAQFFPSAMFPVVQQLVLSWPVNDMLRLICEGITMDSPRLKEIILYADEIDDSINGTQDQALLLAALSSAVMRKIKTLENVDHSVVSELLRRRPDFRPTSLFHLAVADRDEFWAQITACTSLTSLDIKGGTSGIVRHLRQGFPPRVTELSISLYPDLDCAHAFAEAERVIVEFLARPNCAAKLEIASPEWLHGVGTEDARRARAAELRGWARSKAPWTLFDDGAEGRRRLEEAARELEGALAAI